MSKDFKKFIFIYNTKAKFFITPRSSKEDSFTKDELLLFILTLQFRLKYFDELEKKGRDRYKN